MQYIGCISAFGGNIFDYFIDNGINKFSICSQTDLAFTFVSSAKCAGLKVYKIIGTEKKRFKTNIDFRVDMLPIEEIGEYDENVPMLYIDPFPDKEMVDKIKKLTTKKIFTANAILSYAYIKNGLINPIRSYLKENNLNAVCLLCNMATAL